MLCELLLFLLNSLRNGIAFLDEKFEIKRFALNSLRKDREHVWKARWTFCASVKCSFSLVMKFWCFAGRACTMRRLCRTGMCSMASNSPVHFLPSRFIMLVCFCVDENLQVAASFPSPLYVLTLSLVSVWSMCMKFKTLLTASAVFNLYC